MTFENYFNHLKAEKKDIKKFNCSLFRTQDDSLVFEMTITAYSKEQARFKFINFLKRKYPEYLNDSLYWILIKEIEEIKKDDEEEYDPEKNWWWD